MMVDKVGEAELRIWQRSCCVEVELFDTLQK